MNILDDRWASLSHSPLRLGDCLARTSTRVHKIHLKKHMACSKSLGIRNFGHLGPALACVISQI